MSFSTLAVLGAGAWGTALATVFASRFSTVYLHSRNKEEIDRLIAERENRTYLPGIRLPDNIRPVHAWEPVAEAEVIFSVVPSSGVRATAAKLAECNLRSDVIIVSCTKGIEHSTGLLMSQIIEQALPSHHVAVLSGPNYALETARGVPTAAVLGCADPDALNRLQVAFCLRTFRCYSSTDCFGIQLGGALKNIYAIAAGACDGFGLGDNTKAAIVTRSLAEMIRLGTALGGRPETFSGLSGVGDLMLTCYGRLSRNRAFGEGIGQGKSIQELMKSSSGVIEGVPAALSARECADRLGLHAPLARIVCEVVHEGKPAREAMEELLCRDPRPEAA